AGDRPSTRENRGSTRRLPRGLQTCPRCRRWFGLCLARGCLSPTGPALPPPAAGCWGRGARTPEGGMRKRRVVSVVVLIGVLLTAWRLVSALASRPDTVTRDNLKRIDLGMSYEEVEAIFGFPATVSRPPHAVEAWTRDVPGGVVQFKEWCGSESVIM